jgi:uncharacterized repeat protein (TIGR01451 family)
MPRSRTRSLTRWQTALATMAITCVLAFTQLVPANAAIAATAAITDTKLYLSKTAVDASGKEISASVRPGSTFSYKLTVYCSQVGMGCVNARTVDVIPAGVTITPPRSTAGYRVWYSATSRTLIIAYTDRLHWRKSPTGALVSVPGLQPGVSRTVLVKAAVNASTPAGRILNTAKAYGSNARQVTESAAITVGGKGPLGVTTTVAIFPDAALTYTPNGTVFEGESSPITLNATTQNTSAGSVSSMTLMKGSTGGHKVEISGLRIMYPQGATVATVTFQCAVSPQPAPLVLDSRPGGILFDASLYCRPFDPLVEATVVFEGLMPSGATGGLAYHGTLTDLATAPTFSECVDGVVTSTAGQGVQTGCGTLQIQRPFGPSGRISASTTYTGGVNSDSLVFHGQPISFQLTVTNTGATPATALEFDDPVPGAPGNQNVFNALGLTSASAVTSPITLIDNLNLEVFDPDRASWVGYFPDAALLTRAQGLRVRLVQGEVPPGGSITVAATAALRASLAIGRTVSNCQQAKLTNGDGVFKTGPVCAPTVTAGD